MLVLNHAERDFYGAQYERQFQDWYALPGPDMRARLDSVHQKVGLPTLNASHYDEGSLAKSV